MLENILINYFGLKEDWNDDEETKKDNWYNAYDKLISLVYDLGELGVIYSADKTIDCLDEIDTEGEF